MQNHQRHDLFSHDSITTVVEFVHEQRFHSSRQTDTERKDGQTEKPSWSLADQNVPKIHQRERNRGLGNHGSSFAPQKHLMVMLSNQALIVDYHFYLCWECCSEV